MAASNSTLSPLARLQGAADGLDTLQNEAHAHATRVSALLREASAAWEEDRRELSGSCEHVLRLEADVERLTLERDEARRMTEERSYAFVHFPILCQWIAALDPWAADERAEHHCHFCGVTRFADSRTLTENAHRPTCAWKFATDSIPAEASASSLPAPITPAWWTTCSENGHDVTILEKDGGMSEFFCSDCSRGESRALRPTARITSFLGKTLERPIPLYGTNGDSE